MTADDEAALGEDVADLRVTVEALAAQLEETEAKLEALRELAARPPADDGAKPDHGGRGDGKPPAPPLILRLPPDQYDAELAQLDQWVRYVLVPTYLDEITSNAPWCSRWWEHPHAVARLHALWVAWQELTTPEAGGWTGPSVWHRDHLDPCMAQLRSPAGPFAACMTTETLQHALLAPLPAVPVPEPNP